MLAKPHTGRATCDKLISMLVGLAGSWHNINYAELQGRGRSGGGAVRAHFRVLNLRRFHSRILSLEPRKCFGRKSKLHVCNYDLETMKVCHPKGASKTRSARLCWRRRQFQ